MPQPNRRNWLSWRPGRTLTKSGQAFGLDLVEASGPIGVVGQAVASIERRVLPV
jgi:hypothetical protein